MCNSMDVYKTVGKIGQGAHGEVVKAINKRTGQEVAMKRIHYKRANEVVPRHVLREILCLKLVDNHFVVELLDVFAHTFGCVLVFDYMPAALSDMIHDEDYTMTEPEIKTYMYMLLRGLAHIHKIGIMHRDLKPENLLIDKQGILKIADFGLGRLFQQHDMMVYSHQVATRWYRAPELLYSAKRYDVGVDLWAAGCIFAEMITKAPLFPGDNDIEQIALVHYILGTPNEKIWPGYTKLPDYNKIIFPHREGIPFTQILPEASPDVVELVSRFLSYDSKRRPSADEALTSPYFFKDPMPKSINSLRQPFFADCKKVESSSSLNIPLEDAMEMGMDEIFQDLQDMLSLQDPSFSDTSDLSDTDAACLEIPYMTRRAYILNLLKDNLRNGSVSRSVESISFSSGQARKKSRRNKPFSFCFSSCVKEKV